MKNKILKMLIKVSLKKKYQPHITPVYIHIPKTGGTYLAPK